MSSLVFRFSQIQQEKAYLDKVKDDFKAEREMRENAERKVQFLYILFLIVQNRMRAFTLSCLIINLIPF